MAHGQVRYLSLASPKGGHEPGDATEENLGVAILASFSDGCLATEVTLFFPFLKFPLHSLPLESPWAREMAAMEEQG